MDEEFRKPYEYHEEKRGFILVFILTLITFDILQTLSLSAQVNEVFKAVPVFRIFFLILSISFVIFTIYTAMNCYRLKKNLVKMSKLYLIVRAIISTCYVVIIYVYRSSREHLVGNGQQQYQTVNAMVMGELIIPLAYVVGFSVIWYVYFTLSKRCKKLVSQ
jgi:phosphoglycerol transferase MdoB-like AlkP superfamily enzyme